MPAGVACVDVATQPRRPAGQELVDDRTLLPAPSGITALGAGGLEVPLEDLRDLVPRSLSHLLGGDELRS